MSIISDAKRAFSGNIPALEGDYLKIDNARKLYNGNPSWLRIKKGGLYSGGDRRMFTINAARTVADEMTALMICEGVDISIDAPDYADFLGNILRENSFLRRLPDFFSKAFALGGGAIKLSPWGDSIKIEMIQGDSFLPISWNNRGIDGGIFRSKFTVNGWSYTMLERYSLNGFGDTTLERALFRSHYRWELGEAVSLKEIGLDDEVVTFVGGGSPMFAYFKPPVSSGDDFSPLGCSIYEKSKDTLNALDITFDSLTREFVLGKKRIIIPHSCIRTVVDPDSGKMKRYFDADDEAFVALKSEDGKDLQINDNTAQLRVNEHISAIKTLINILCFQIGISSDGLAFDSVRGLKTVKTATEVISQDSKTARTINMYKGVATDFLGDMVRGIMGMGVCMGSLESHPYNLNISWKDSVIVDDSTVISDNIRLVQAGLRSKERAISEINRCDNPTALAEIDKIIDRR